MSRKVMKLALDALEGCYLMFYEDEGRAEAITALRDELAKPEPEPVGYFVEYPGNEWAKHTFEQLADIHANDTDVVCVPLYRNEYVE